MSKLTKKITSFRYFYETILFVILGYFTSKVAVSSTDYYFSFMLFDYSHGYMTRGFVGEVISWFTNSVTEKMAYGIVVAVFVLLSLACALLLGRAVRNCDEQFRPIVAAIGFCLVLSPTTFYWLKSNGMQSDLFFYALTMVALLFVKHKYLRWSIPVFASLATLCSVTYSVHCMTLLAIVLLYEFVKEKKKSSGILCLLTYGLIIGISVYAVASRSHLAFQNADELYAYISSKTNGDLLEETIRYYLDEYFLTFEAAVQKYIALEIKKHWSVLVFGTLFVYVPVAILFAGFWADCLKRCKDVLGKIVFALAIVELLFALVPAIFTGEPGRWLSAGVIVEFGLLLYMLADRNENVQQTLSKWMRTVSENNYILIFAAAYVGLLLFLYY